MTSAAESAPKGTAPGSGNPTRPTAFPATGAEEGAVSKYSSRERERACRENMAYDAETDMYSCANGKPVTFEGIKKSKAQSGTQQGRLCVQTLWEQVS